MQSSIMEDAVETVEKSLDPNPNDATDATTEENPPSNQSAKSNEDDNNETPTIPSEQQNGETAVEDAVENPEKDESTKTVDNVENPDEVVPDCQNVQNGENDENCETKSSDAEQVQNANDVATSKDVENPPENTTTTTSDPLIDDAAVVINEINNQENVNPSQKPDDFTPDELTVYNEMFGTGKQSVQFYRLHCTACNEHLGSAPNAQDKRYIHPILKVLQCKKCFDFYGSGEFDKDEDGSELYCRWCGQGGNVLCCSYCCYVFCQRCIRANVGKKALTKIKESDDWTCFSCKPEQTTKSRVICKALYKFTQNEIKAAADSQQPERLDIDHSLCCKEKPKPPSTEKRKLSDSFDLFGDDEEETPKKKKKTKNILSHMSAAVANLSGYQLIPESPNIWESQVEDEVVCTPDLSMLMDDDDPSAQIPTETMDTASPGPSSSSIPPLAPITSKNTNKDSDVQFVGQTRVLASIPQRKAIVVTTANSTGALGYKLPGLLNPIATTQLQTAANNAQKAVVPSLVHLQPSAKPTDNNNEVQPIVRVAHNKNSSVINATPAKLAPGLRYEWFEKATQLTARVNQNLSTRVCSLSKEQYSVTSLEGLASIHNNLQEILSNSINSLMQIRKSLRSDFIAGLKKLKFCKTQAQPTSTDKDNDVVVVDSTPTTTTEQTPSNTTTNANSGANKPMSYIKVKPVSELLDSSVAARDDNAANKNNRPIFTPTNNFVQQKVNPVNTARKTTTTIINGLLNSNSISVVQQNRPVVNRLQINRPIQRNRIQVCNKTANELVKLAVYESKFRAIVNNNLKFNVGPAHQKDMKRMLSVRVVIESDYGKATPRSKPRKGYKAMNVRPLELDEEETTSSKAKEGDKSAKTNETVDDAIQLSDDDDKDDDVQIVSEEAPQAAKEAEKDENSDPGTVGKDKVEDNVNKEKTNEDAPETAASPEESSQKGSDETRASETSKEVGEPMDTNEETSNDVEKSSEKVLKDRVANESCQDLQATDSGIDVHGEQSLSNGVSNEQENNI